MTDFLAALDIGGTKTHLVIEGLDGTRIVDIMEPSLDWEAEPEAEAAPWIAARINKHLPAGGRVVSLAFGAQGINNAAISTNLEAALAINGFAMAKAVNDAALIAPAAGFTQGFGIISGTGAIGVGADKDGKFLAAGGWGSVIGDEGGASALVREATRFALFAHDEGRPDDGLLGYLIAAFGVADAERLTRQVNDEPTPENWAPHAPAIFAAADAGSPLAQAVIEHGARHLAALVGQLRKRGAVGSDVVVAGSVIVNQKRLLDAFTLAINGIDLGLKVHVLHAAPVEGAVLLARQAIGR